VGGGECEAPLQASLASFVQTGVVRFVGLLPPQQVRRAVLPEEDVLLLFSPSEGCPLAVQEALADGVVPVCSDFLGARSLPFLKPGHTCLLFPCGDLQRGADQVEALARSPARLRLLSEQAAQEAKWFYHDIWRRQWQQTLTDLLAMPVRYPGVESDTLHLCGTPPAGRLERLGIPVTLCERIRSAMRRWPRFPDGWAEWPGTISRIDDATADMLNAELTRLDRAAAAEGAAHVSA
jgi:hypothetical protein